MERVLPLSNEQKILVTYRVESGCLGPEGASLVASFCDFAQQKMGAYEADCLLWRICPRQDKTQLEMEYSVANKRLNRHQASILLQLMGKEVNQFEEQLLEHICELIEEYMGR